MDAQKMDDHLVYTTPHHILAKMDVLPKTFLQIILATKRLVRHSSMYVPQAAATTFAFSSVCFFFYVAHQELSIKGLNPNIPLNSAATRSLLPVPEK